MSYKKSKYLNWIIWFNLFIGLFNLYLYTISGWWFSFFVGSLNIGVWVFNRQYLFNKGKDNK